MNVDQILIYNKLRQITPYWQNIVDILNGETFLCGGLLLQTVLCEQWDTDIDIFTTNRDLKSLSFGIWNGEPRGKTYEAIPGVIDVYTGIVPNGKYTNGTFKDLSIDIIQIYDIQSLFYGFDFDFCKIRFDGKNILIEDPISVFNKSCVVKNIYVMRNKDERVKKYTNRGFIIKFPDNNNHTDHNQNITLDEYIKH